MKNFYVFLLGILLGFFVCMMLSTYKEITPNHIPVAKTDTISVTEYKTIVDTIFVDKPKYYKEVVRDTVRLNNFVRNEDKYLVVTQKEYRDSNYVAWVSGVEPQLDSIMVFNNTEYVFKTSTIETVKTIEDKTGKWFMGTGLYRLDNTLVPKLNVVYQKKRIMVGASVGLYNNQPIYGVDINYKIK
mgnify:CR=1 FL=1